MILDLAAVLAGSLAVGGAALGVVGVIGTTRPPSPPSPWALRARRWWTGPGRSRREQRAHQIRILAAAGSAAAVWLVSGWPAAGLIVGLAIPGIPWLYSAGVAERRAIARLEAVEAWTRRLADIVTRGIGLQQAIAATASTAPPAIEQEVRDLVARMQTHADPVEALGLLADELDDYTADQVIAPLMQHVTDRGEGLPQMLTAIARSIAAEIEMRSTVDAKRAAPRFAVRFLTWMTIALLGYGLLNPDYMRPYGTPVGQLVLVALAGFYVLLMVWVRQLSLPPRRGRLLAPAELRAAHPRSPQSSGPRLSSAAVGVGEVRT